jgi:hypothetical protein
MSICVWRVSRAATENRLAPGTCLPRGLGRDLANDLPRDLPWELRNYLPLRGPKTTAARAIALKRHGRAHGGRPSTRGSFTMDSQNRCVVPGKRSLLGATAGLLLALLTGCGGGVYIELDGPPPDISLASCNWWRRCRPPTVLIRWTFTVWTLAARCCWAVSTNHRPSGTPACPSTPAAAWPTLRVCATRRVTAPAVKRSPCSLPTDHPGGCAGRSPAAAARPALRGLPSKARCAVTLAA